MSSQSAPSDQCDHNFHVAWDALHQDFPTHTLFYPLLCTPPPSLITSSSLIAFEHSSVDGLDFFVYGFPFQLEPGHSDLPAHICSCQSLSSHFFCSWSHASRSQIIDNIFKGCVQPRGSRPQALPVGVLVTVTFPLSHDDYPHNVNAEPMRAFLSSWNNLCKKHTQLFTIVPTSPEKLCSTGDAVIQSSLHERTIRPALVVLYISYDAFFTSNIPSIHVVCNNNRAHLVIDGPGFALLTHQHSRRPTILSEIV